MMGEILVRRPQYIKYPIHKLSLSKQCLTYDAKSLTILYGLILWFLYFGD